MTDARIENTSIPRHPAPPPSGLTSTLPMRTLSPLRSRCAESAAWVFSCGLSGRWREGPPFYPSVMALTAARQAAALEHRTGSLASAALHSPDVVTSCDQSHSSLRLCAKGLVGSQQPPNPPEATVSNDTPTTSGGLFDKLAGKAKQALSKVTGNDDLAEEGSLQVQKAETAVEAARLQAEADQADREAELAAERERNQVEQARVEADLAERDRADQIARGEQAAKAEVAQHDARKHEAAAAKDRAEASALEREEVDALADRIDGTQEAAEIDAEARQAENVAEVLAAAQENLNQKTTEG